uniref:WGS project CAEQ00000000 data, annotated contig 1311 n=1 Tax=Trypanosoma congolense (strain IL3000) TaxID=1068625 RepID=F9W5C9_TRYCI|nr:unnamed protein product [Trypanosoma congolense IL3000]
MEKERVLICGACVCNESNEVALSQATVICDKDDVGADDYKEEPCSETADAPSLVQPVEKVEENELDLSDVYVVPAFLPQERWEETLRNLAGEDLEAKVAWWSLLDSPAAYVNGKPVVLYPRHELQWVEGRPGFDELAPCIDVIQKAPVYVPEVEEVVGNETVTPTPCSCTVNESSEISASHISLEKDCKSWRSEPDSPDCARTNPDEGDGCAFSVFDAPLSVEDLYLSSELKESYQEKGTKKIPHYNTLGPVAEYGIPAPVYGLQPLVLMSDSLGGALPNKSGIITNSFVEVGSAAGDTMPREMSFALGNEAEQGPLADGAEWEHADGASCRYSDKPIASAFSPSEKVSAEHSATPVVETVSAMAMLVAQRSLPEGFFAHRRPWFTPICSRARAATFAEFMIGVLHQLRAGCKVVVAAEDPYQIMFFNAVCLLKLAAKEEDRLEDTASSSMSLRDVDNSAVPMHENLSGGTGGWLSLLKTFYEEVGKIVNTTAVSVDECAVTVQNVMRKASPGGLIFLEQIPSLMQRVEGETDERLMRESILTIVQRIELYYWLVLFQVFLVSILKSQSTSMRIETSLAKFHVFVNDPHILRLLDQIDPWRDVPQRSPDPLHLRYSNGLRRWEQQHFIFRGATSL